MISRSGQPTPISWLTRITLRSCPQIAEGKRSEPLKSAKSSSKTVHDPVVAVHGRPTYSAFPGVEATHFGGGVPQGALVHACGVLREKFEQKEMLKARVNFLLYQAR